MLKNNSTLIIFFLIFYLYSLGFQLFNSHRKLGNEIIRIQAFKKIFFYLFTRSNFFKPIHIHLTVILGIFFFYTLQSDIWIVERVVASNNLILVYKLFLFKKINRKIFFMECNDYRYFLKKKILMSFFCPYQ